MILHGDSDRIDSTHSTCTQVCASRFKDRRFPDAMQNLGYQRIKCDEVLDAPDNNMRSANIYFKPNLARTDSSPIFFLLRLRMDIEKEQG